MFDATTIVKRSDRQVACNLNGEVALLDLDKGLYFGLQDVGAHIWNALQEPRPVDEIISTVLSHFDVAPEVCRDDVVKFLASLQEAGMIEVLPAGGAAFTPHHPVLE
jgi:hypothetical protein